MAIDAETVETKRFQIGFVKIEEGKRTLGGLKIVKQKGLMIVFVRSADAWSRGLFNFLSRPK